MSRRLTQAPAKLTRPMAGGLLRRPRPLGLLDPACAAVWLMGPPGSGKTALATSYIEAWAMAPRERLRRRLLRALEALGRAREQMGDLEGALSSYLHGLQVDDLAEHVEPSSETRAMAASLRAKAPRP